MKHLHLILFYLVTCTWSFSDETKIVFLAGGASHAPGEHEHRAGCLLLESCLADVPGVTSVVYSNGWPRDPETAFADVDAIVVYSDGQGRHPLLQGQRLETIRQLMERGVGLACIHYAVEPTKQKGQAEFIEWIGGAFEIHWSVNPLWEADFKSLPDHPVTRGVEPFTLYDEWYFHMRFRDDMAGVTPILSAVPPETTMRRRDGPHSGNPVVRELVDRGEPQHVAWVVDRKDGGRGFGFTGAHSHENWGDDNFRKLVLNAILWVAGLEVPDGGVESSVTPEQLQANLDPKGKR